MSVLALKRVLILCFALVFAWGVPVPAFAVPAPANKIGINVNTPLDWIRDRAFTDVMKASRQWLTQSNTPAGVDANGWPTQDANIVVWAGPPNMQWTYRFSFTGQAKWPSDTASSTIS